MALPRRLRIPPLLLLPLPRRSCQGSCCPQSSTSGPLPPLHSPCMASGGALPGGLRGLKGFVAWVGLTHNNNSSSKPFVSSTNSSTSRCMLRVAPLAGPMALTLCESCARRDLTPPRLVQRLGAPSAGQVRPEDPWALSQALVSQRPYGLAGASAQALLFLERGCPSTGYPSLGLCTEGASQRVALAGLHRRWGTGLPLVLDPDRVDGARPTKPCDSLYDRKLQVGAGVPSVISTGIRDTRLRALPRSSSDEGPASETLAPLAVLSSIYYSSVSLYWQRPASGPPDELFELQLEVETPCILPNR